MYIVHACPGFVCSRDAMPGTESCSEIQKQRGSHKQSLLNMNEKCRAHTVIECVAVMCRMGPPLSGWWPRATVYARVVQNSIPTSSAEHTFLHCCHVHCAALDPPAYVAATWGVLLNSHELSKALFHAWLSCAAWDPPAHVAATWGVF